jgi:hypothetical protein
MSNAKRFVFDVSRIERKTHSFIIESEEGIDIARSAAVDAACNHDYTQHNANDVNYEAELTMASAGAKTVNREDQYMNYGGSICPACYSRNIEAGSVEVEGQEAFQKVLCNDCEVTWEDRFELVGISTPEGFDPEEVVRPVKQE